MIKGDSDGRNVTSLIITKLSYVDAGTYACQVREDGEWVSADIELVLTGEVYCWDGTNTVLLCICDE